MCSHHKITNGKGESMSKEEKGQETTEKEGGLFDVLENSHEENVNNENLPLTEEESPNEDDTESSESSESPESPEDPIFREFERLYGQQVLIVTESAQLNLLGQTFRPIFCGTIVEVTLGHVSIYPANIKLLNAPFYQFPTPLSIPLEKIAHFTPNFDCNQRIPLI